MRSAIDWTTKAYESTARLVHASFVHLDWWVPMNTALLGVLLAFSTHSTPDRPQPWSFVQSVGGIKVGSAVRRNGGWILPMEADVSGLKAVTRMPSALNSGLSCRETSAVVRDTAIFIAVVTGAAGTGKRATCPPAELGSIPPGTYSVFYGEPGAEAVLLREISIEIQGK